MLNMRRKAGPIDPRRVTLLGISIAAINAGGEQLVAQAAMVKYGLRTLASGGLMLRSCYSPANSPAKCCKGSDRPEPVRSSKESSWPPFESCAVVG